MWTRGSGAEIGSVSDFVWGIFCFFILFGVLGNLILSENVTKSADGSVVGDREEEMANLKTSIEKQGEAKDELDLSDKQISGNNVNVDYFNNGSILLNRILQSGEAPQSSSWAPFGSVYLCLFAVFVGLNKKSLF